MSRSQSSDGNPEGRTGDVIKADLVTEDDRGRISSMLATDAQFNIRPGCAAFLTGDFDQLANTVLIERDKWIIGKKAAFNVKWQELAGVVTREAKSGLGQIIGTEGEEFSFLSNLVSSQG